MTTYHMEMDFFVTYDETTGEKNVEQTFYREFNKEKYELRVTRNHSYYENTNSDNIIKRFNSEKECIDWINSLKIHEARERSCQKDEKKATKENLYNTNFCIEKSDPNMTPYVDIYHGVDLRYPYIVLNVTKKKYA